MEATLSEIETSTTFSVQKVGFLLTPKIAGRRLHHTMEEIPCHPWKSRSPFASRPIERAQTGGGVRGVREVRGGTSSISIVWCPGRPDISVPVSRI